MSKGKVLVAVLNWGLGHATRCIPVIRSLQQENYQPIIASDGSALSYLRNELPELVSYELNPLHITYGPRSAFNFPYLMLKSLFWNAHLKKDASLIHSIHEKEHLTGIISDGRPYAFHRDVPSVYITHQLQVKSGLFSRSSTAIHRQLIRRFDECWVPDLAPPHNVCGLMSQWKNADIPLRYIGIPSDLTHQKRAREYDHAAIIAGAEPERTKLEKKLIACFRELSGKNIILAGSKQRSSEKITDNLEIIGMASRAEVAQVMSRSDTLVVRGGYSTIMDLIKLQRKALLVPTPGQTEQLYLAEHLQRHHHFDRVSQAKLSAERIRQFSESKYRSNNIAFAGFDLREVFGLFQGE